MADLSQEGFCDGSDVGEDAESGFDGAGDFLIPMISENILNRLPERDNRAFIMLTAPQVQMPVGMVLDLPRPLEQPVRVRYVGLHVPPTQKVSE